MKNFANNGNQIHVKVILGRDTSARLTASKMLGVGARMTRNCREGKGLRRETQLFPLAQHLFLTPKLALAQPMQSPKRR